MANHEKLSEDFIATAQSILASNDEEARKKLFATATQAMAMLEDPVDTIWRLVSSPQAPSALTTLIKAGVIQQIFNSDSPVTADELAKTSGADKLLIVRLMRPLNALGIVKETSSEVYGATRVTKILREPAMLGMFQFMSSATTRSLANMPFYLEKTGFKHPSGSPGPFQDAHKTADGLFPWLIKDPAMMANFQAFMSGQRGSRTQWFDLLDVDAMLLADPATKDPEAALLVDVGGGGGHDIAEFYRRFPHVQGRLVLQDLPEVIDAIVDLDGRIERVKHDFFEPQPVKGARCYYFRSILHDWPEADCIKILKHIAAAMKPGYSKILLSEWVMPASNTGLYAAAMDINMMALLNSLERTEAQWTHLLDAAGLKVVKFWSCGVDTEGIVEATLKDEVTLKDEDTLKAELPLR
ncbi:S-adenosyl-L-methionine-dependent methyltransferase [Xylariaceae sp. FL0804]|nr:S-adenosyl-L-methionine-dependent methyltransferase [Xylariaceae sp. FL0804]